MMVGMLPSFRDVDEAIRRMYLDDVASLEFSEKKMLHLLLWVYLSENKIEVNATRIEELYNSTDCYRVLDKLVSKKLVEKIQRQGSRNVLYKLTDRGLHVTRYLFLEIEKKKTSLINKLSTQIIKPIKSSDITGGDSAESYAIARSLAKTCIESMPPEKLMNITSIDEESLVRECLEHLLELKKDSQSKFILKKKLVEDILSRAESLNPYREVASKIISTSLGSILTEAHLYIRSKKLWRLYKICKMVLRFFLKTSTTLGILVIIAIIILAFMLYNFLPR